MSLALEHADGSWSWMVLLASLVTQALTASFPVCIGIFFADLQHDFQANNSEISWFPSILGAMLQAGGPLCSILVQHYGCRVTMMMGGLLASLGMVASSFCYSLSQFYLTAGMVTGLVLDTTGNFVYIFCLSAFFLISAGLFMTGGFYYVKKKEQKGMPPKAEETISETSLIQGLAPEGKDIPPEMVTSV